VIYYFDELDSTNTKIKELAIGGAEHGTVVVADKQTAGKGRRGRTWESPAGANLYFSILLRPSFATEKAPMLTLVMAYSAAKVIREQLYMEAMIKWPNDLVLSKKKICGILTEMSLKGMDIDYIVVGTGINVNLTTFPEELKETATSLFLEKGVQVDRDALLDAVLQEFWKQYEIFAEIQDLSDLQREYNEILVNCGKEVCVLEPGNEYKAIAQGINETGELLVTKADGSASVVYAGEVSVRGIYGYV
jgi:BirA family biotin operon repressor/biotin-[acetyl-CoA-carboxylase] ligase